MGYAILQRGYGKKEGHPPGRGGFNFSCKQGGQINQKALLSACFYQVQIWNCHSKMLYFLDHRSADSFSTDGAISLGVEED